MSPVDLGPVRPFTISTQRLMHEMYSICRRFKLGDGLENARPNGVLNDTLLVIWKVLQVPAEVCAVVNLRLSDASIRVAKRYTLGFLLLERVIHRNSEGRSKPKSMNRVQELLSHQIGCWSWKRSWHGTSRRIPGAKRLGVLDARANCDDPLCSVGKSQSVQ